MNSIQFIVLLDGSAYKPMFEHMLTDLLGLKNVTFIVDNQNLNKRKRILLKRKVRYITKGKIDFLAFEKNNLFFEIKRLYEQKKRVCVLFFNSALYYNPYLPGTLREYKKRWPGLKYVLFYLDIMNSSVSANANLLRKDDLFDLVYTIDVKDSEETGSKLWRTFYSTNKNFSEIRSVKDMYFCGVAKGREGILCECVDAAINHSINIDMDIICEEYIELLERYKDVIQIHKKNDYISYPEVLSRELDAKCILDIVQNGQAALTLRPYEAVVYNRKLLTNNPSIFNFPFYNPTFIQYFTKVEDIDWEWVRTEKKVDYNYKGEFSPLFLLEDIERVLKE